MPNTIRPNMRNAFHITDPFWENPPVTSGLPSQKVSTVRNSDLWCVLGSCRTNCCTRSQAATWNAMTLICLATVMVALITKLLTYLFDLSSFEILHRVWWQLRYKAIIRRVQLWNHVAGLTNLRKIKRQEPKLQLWWSFAGVPRKLYDGCDLRFISNK